MTHRRRKGKKHRPITPADTLDFLRPAAPEQRDLVLARFGSALQVMASGSKPTEQEWRDLADMVNTCEALVDMGKLIPDEVMPTLTEATVAMVKALRRRDAGQRLGLDGPGLEAMRDVLSIYTQCAHGFTVIEMSQARRLVAERVAKALRTRDPQAVSA